MSSQVFSDSTSTPSPHVDWDVLCLKEKCVHASCPKLEVYNLLEKEQSHDPSKSVKNGTIWIFATSNQPKSVSALLCFSLVRVLLGCKHSVAYKLVQRERVSGIKARRLQTPNEIEKISPTHMMGKKSNESLWMSDPNKSIIALGAVKSCVHPLAKGTHFSVSPISPRSSQKGH